MTKRQGRWTTSKTCFCRPLPSARLGLGRSDVGASGGRGGGEDGGGGAPGEVGEVLAEGVQAEGPAAAQRVVLAAGLVGGDDGLSRWPPASMVAVPPSRGSSSLRPMNQESMPGPVAIASQTCSGLAGRVVSSSISNGWVMSGSPSPARTSPERTRAPARTWLRLGSGVGGAGIWCSPTTTRWLRPRRRTRRGSG